MSTIVISELTHWGLSLFPLFSEETVFALGLFICFFFLLLVEETGGEKKTKCLAHAFHFSLWVILLANALE